MKRTQETMTQSQRYSSHAVAGSSRRKPAKRPRYIQACASCRKQKTRCEILYDVDAGAPVRCHRCKALNNDCSFSEMDRGLFLEFLKPPASKDSQLASEEEQAVGVANILDAGNDAAAEAAQRPGERVVGSFDNMPTIPDHILDSIVGLRKRDLFDWSAPLMAVDAIMNPHSPEIRPNVSHNILAEDLSLESILNLTQIVELLQIFDARYTPWLNFPLIRSENSHILDLICCTVASRHLEASLRSTVAPRLHKLTQDTVVKLIPQSAKSVESIQALLILSLWSPVYGSADSGIQEGRVLLASAVSMAMDLRLHEVPAKVALDTAGQTNRTSEIVYSDDMNKARLWISLTNTESMLCVGMGRMPLSRRSLIDTNFLSSFFRSPSNVMECRDLRSRFSADLCNATERGKDISLVSLADVDTWFDQACDVLRDMDRYQRLLAPLPTISDYEPFYFQMSMVTLFGCRLLTLYHFIHSARSVSQACAGGGEKWYRDIRPRGIYSMRIWGRDALAACEAVLLTFLQADKSLINTTPDYLFHIIGFAAALLTGIKFRLLKAIGMEMRGSSDTLLAKTLDRLCDISFSDDHVAKRCAYLIHTMIALWEKRKHEWDYGGVDGAPPGNPSATIIPSSGAVVVDEQYASAQPQLEPLGSLTASQTEPQSDFGTTEAEATWFMNLDMFQDAEFWSQLLGAQDHPPEQ